jgi:hypothetical protein
MGGRGPFEVHATRREGVQVGVEAAAVRGSGGAIKELGLNPPCGLPLGYSPEEGDNENLDSTVYPGPSWNVAGE